MALVEHAFSVNVTPGEMPPIVHVSEYDTGRTYTVTINGQNGSAFNIPTGTTATVEGTLNGVIGFTTDATISGSTVSFTLTESMTAKSGKAWCKIKLTLNDEPIQTCAFILSVDRAGVEAETVIGAPGFQEQINEGVAEYFDNDPPFFELPSGGQSGQALLSDGADGAYWGEAQGGGSGLTEEAKQALLACFAKVVWVDADGQNYYDALEAALYPTADLASISAAFNQGSHVVYNTDTLDSLKPYLTVRAIYSNGTTQTVTNYTLSGTLAVGTSTITVSYGGKTTTFTVTVTAEYVPTANYVEVGSPNIVNNVLYPTDSNGGYIRSPQQFNHGSNPWKIKFAFSASVAQQTANLFRTADASGNDIRSILSQQVSNYLQVYLCSNNGSTWDISAGTNMQFTSFAVNTKYFVEYSFDGTKYAISVTNESGTVMSGIYHNPLNSSAAIYDGAYLCFGKLAVNNIPFNGQIFLEDIEVYINNQLWWKAVE